MINTALRHNTIIGRGQEESDKALGALLSKKTGTYGKWRVAGRDKLASYSLYYDGWLIAKYSPLFVSAYVMAWQVTDGTIQASVMNRLLKRFNIRCGLRDGSLFFRQLEGVAHQWSEWEGNVKINLRRTRECTSQHLWFMSYC